MRNCILFVIFYVMFCIINVTHCWDNTEMQMFDLVEELNETFYEYMGVNQNSSSADIRRAYRKLSLVYHPDKNPNAEGAIKFRRLVGIYEILKEDKMRERYNEVLKFGLPDWRMPAYYFRKLRKMSFGESFLLLAILATAIHYACLWGAYLDQKLNMEDYLFRRKRQRTNVNIMNEQLNTGYKPRWKDILPLVLVRSFYNFVVSTPQNIKLTCGLVKQEITTAIDKQFEKKRKDKQREEEKKKIEENKKQKKDRKQILSKGNVEKRKIYETGIQNAMTLPVETFHDIPAVSDHDRELPDDLPPWCDTDTIALIRALSKYPAGVGDRWIKISDFVKRPLLEVTKKVKEIQASSKEGKIPINTKMQNSFAAGIEDQFESQDYATSESESNEGECSIKSSAQKKKERKQMLKQNMTAAIPIEMSDEAIKLSTKYEDNDLGDVPDETSVHLRKKPRTKIKYLETAEPVDNSTWTQTEQKQLEDAMRAFPKGTIDRWDRISQKIPTKTKAECIERIKKLSQSVQEKNSRSVQ